MTKEAHAKLIEEIRNAKSDVERNNALLTLSQDYKTVQTETETLKAENATLKKENVEYAQLNNKLFLQLGGNTQQEQTQEQQQEQNNPPEKLKFEDLKFD